MGYMRSYLKVNEEDIVWDSGCTEDVVDGWLLLFSQQEIYCDLVEFGSIRYNKPSNYLEIVPYNFELDPDGYEELTVSIRVRSIVKHIKDRLKLFGIDNKIADFCMKFEHPEDFYESIDAYDIVQTIDYCWDYALLYNTIRLLDDHISVEYDLSELFLHYENYDNYDDALLARQNDYDWCFWKLQNLHEENQIVILAEGSDDITVLSNSLKFLYPHLQEYFQFIDFHESNYGGGAPEIIKIIKAFIAIKLKKRVIAIFDNDTMAREALSTFRKNNIKIPNNIKILHYPDVEFLKSYPTIGPTGGITLADVNGLAGSIELYLGKDVLTGYRETEECYPVQWKSYNNTLKCYHGEIMNKSIFIEKFLLKCNVQTLNQDDWVELQAIWEEMIGVFSA